MFSPSNIIQGQDGAYYAFLKTQSFSNQRQSVCLMRTSDLSDPGAWRFWDGSGFEGRFVDPYREPTEDARQHVCPPLALDEIGAQMIESVTYNEYLGRYVLVGISADFLEGREVWGFFYSTSFDLVNWTRRKLLMEVELPWTVEHPAQVNVLYPALLDPESGSRNFETTGQTAYLYFTRNNFGHTSLDRDLLRVPVAFFPSP
jgi:hypothetical protein